MIREEVLKLAKQNKLLGETDKQVEDYINTHYDKFYVYCEDDEVKGYADYFIVENTLYIYDMVCKGNIWKMMEYCRQFMRKHNLKYIEFKRLKQGNKYKKYRRY